MKKILFMVAAVALMAMVSCNKENANDAPQVKEPSVVVEFSASISMGDENTAAKPQSSAATRTTVDHSVLKDPKTLWLETDKISINGVKFKVKELKNGGASAVFVNEDYLPEDFGAPYTAVYPYAAYADGGDGKITKITLPSTQTAKAGDFPENAVCAAAYSNDAVLKFKNVASVLMFQVAKACQTVTISSDNPLAGTVSMTPNGDDEIPIFSDGTENTVTINGPFATDTKYYVAVLPGVKDNFVVCLDGQVSKRAPKITIQRSGFADMKTLPAPVVQADRELAFSKTQVSTTYGDDFTEPTLNGETAGVKYSSSDTGVATVDEQTGKVTIVAGGETTITATAEEAETLKAGTASYTLTVNKAQRNLAFSNTSATADTRFGLTAAPTLSGVIDNVTYKSSKTSVATVAADGKVTIKGVGTATITASAPETNIYTSGTATYKLTVEQGKIKIYVYLYPKEKGWSEWNCNPYIHYFDSQTISATQWTGAEMTLQEQYEGKNRYYYEFNYHTTDKISVVINNNGWNNNFKQTVDVVGLALNTDHSLEVWTDWESDGKLKVGILK